MSILIKNGLVLTLDENNDNCSRMDIFVEKDLISIIGKNLDETRLKLDRIIDGTGYLITPGLINADLHPLDLLFLGLFENIPFEILTFILYSDELNHLLTPDVFYCLSQLSAMMSLKNGVSAIQDHWILPENDTRTYYQSVCKGHQDVGIRSRLSLEINQSSLQRMPYMNSVIPSLLRKPEDASNTSFSAETPINIYDEILGLAFSGDHCFQDLAIALSLQDLENSSLVDWVQSHNTKNSLPIHIHLNETKSDHLYIKERWNNGLAPIESMEQIGLLTPQTSISSAVWSTHFEINRLASKGVSVIHTPMSDLFLGKGLFPVNLFMDHQVNIALGTGTGTGGNLNLFDVMKLTASIHRVAQPDHKRWPTVDQILNMATLGGARALGLEGKIGRIKEGYQSDMVLYDLKKISLVPLNNIKSQLVCLENGSGVDMVIVNGEIVLENGIFNSINENEVWDQYNQIRQELSMWFKSSFHKFSLVEPYLLNGLKNNTDRQIEINRWGNNPPMPSRLGEGVKI